jgi:hypothetical protein
MPKGKFVHISGERLETPKESAIRELDRKFYRTPPRWRTLGGFDEHLCTFLVRIKYDVRITTYIKLVGR